MGGGETEIANFNNCFGGVDYQGEEMQFSEAKYCPKQKKKVRGRERNEVENLFQRKKNI